MVWLPQLLRQGAGEHHRKLMLLAEDHLDQAALDRKRLAKAKDADSVSQRRPLLYTES
ncbi:MAG: hypothetical protein JSR31_06325 [Nitrospira sp.]|nr:hypothetical protein [Nitrospira sp.]